MITLPQKLSFSRLPTPIEKLEQISREWNVDLRVKRDDLTGTELTGNKIRKLDYLLADALRQECDTIITCGAVTSNHARATALAARKLGLQPVLVLTGTGKQPDHLNGNLQLSLLCGAQIRYVSWEIYANSIDEHLLQVAEEIRQSGNKPYIIPTGGSNPVGLLGYFDAAGEIKQQCEDENWLPDVLVCAVGSGGTYSGLLMGNTYYKVADQVLGILVCASIPYFTAKIMADTEAAADLFKFPFKTGDKAVRLYDSYIGEGYAKTNAVQLDMIRYAAAKEALILEPVYTGKAFYGMADLIRTGEIPRGAKVLFIHTGGIYGLSAFTEAMSNHWGNLTEWGAANSFISSQS